MLMLPLHALSGLGKAGRWMSFCFLLVSFCNLAPLQLFLERGAAEISHVRLATVCVQYAVCSLWGQKEAVVVDVCKNVTCKWSRCCAVLSAHTS